MARNGYLRREEFQRWAVSVDDSLKNITSKVEIHGQLLAVYEAFQKRHDVYRSIIGSLVAAVVAALMTAILHWYRP